MYVVLALLLLGVLIIAHEGGHFWAARACGIGVQDFSMGMGPLIAKWQSKKGTQFSVRLLPIGGYCQFYGEDEEKNDPRAFNNQPVWKRAITVFSGPLMNFVIAFLVIALFMSAIGVNAVVPKVAQVEETAQAAGLQIGDEITAVNGETVATSDAIAKAISASNGEAVTLTVKRDGQKVELPDVQFDTWQDENGQTHMTLGFTVYGIKKTPLNVLKEAWNSTLYYGRIVFTSLADLVRGRESINNLSGPVGIVTAIGQAASYGWQDLLELLALITINLGVFNLLPFPALDGGKVVFLIIEGVTGHAVPEKLQGTLTIAAFALLFGLMLFATYNDIIRLVTGAM